MQKYSSIIQSKSKKKKNCKHLESQESACYYPLKSGKRYLPGGLVLATLLAQTICPHQFMFSSNYKKKTLIVEEFIRKIIKKIEMKKKLLKNK